MLSRPGAALRPDERVSPHRGRVVAINLILVLAFVVVAIIELTRIYVAARHIASSIDTANTHLVPVQVNTAQTQRLDTTIALTQQIDKATASLEPKTRTIEQNVAHIQAGAASVQNTVADINSKIDDITDTARTISATATATALATTVADISQHRGLDPGQRPRHPHQLRHPVPGHHDDRLRAAPSGVQTITLNVDAIITRALDIQADLNNIVITVPEIDRRRVNLPQHPGHGPALRHAGATPDAGSTTRPRTSRRGRGGAPHRGGPDWGHRYPVTARDPVEGRSQLGELGIRQRLQHQHVHRRSTKQEIVRVHGEPALPGSPRVTGSNNPPTRPAAPAAPPPPARCCPPPADP